MSNYPNMSYCMFQNTKLAMDQLNEFMMEVDFDDLLDMNRDEVRAMQELVGYCEQYLELVNEFAERQDAAQRLAVEDTEEEEF